MAVASRVATPAPSTSLICARRPTPARVSGRTTSLASAFAASTTTSSIASALIGHARWAQATPGWTEPPHLWLGVVGEPGTGKSPGSDALLRDVLPEIERRMLADFPDRLWAWRTDVALSKAAKQRWRHELR